MWGRRRKLRREAVIIWAKFMVYRLLSWTLSLRYGRRREYVGWACILRNDHLGDFFISWPVLAGLAAWFHERGMPVAVFSSARMRDFVAATGLFDAVETVDARALGQSLWRRLLAYAWLRHLAPEAFVSLICVPEARLGINDLIARFVGAREKYACAMRLIVRRNFRWNFVYWSQGNGFYSHLSRVGRRSTLPDVEAGICQMVTGRPLLPAPEFPRSLAALPPEVVGLGAYCVVAPGAADPERRWPAERFREWATLARGRDPGLRIVVVGTAAERPLGEEIGRGQPDGAVSNLCGRTSLAELVAVIRGARFVLANDSGALHVAGRLHVPVACVIGGGHFGLYAPNDHYPTARYAYHRRRCFWCGWDCRQAVAPGATHPCIMDVTVAEVLAITAPLLGGTTG